MSATANSIGSVAARRPKGPAKKASPRLPVHKGPEVSRFLAPGKGEEADRGLVLAPKPSNGKRHGPSISVQVIAAMRLDAKHAREVHGIDRVKIAQRMSKELGYEVSPTRIDSIMKDSNNKRLALEEAAAWTLATGSTHALGVVCERAGMAADCYLVVQLGRKAREQIELDSERAALENEVRAGLEARP